MLKNLFKKLIIFVFLLSNLSSIFAVNNSKVDLSLEVSIPPQTYKPFIYYNGSQLSENEKVLDNNNKPFDITENGSTDDFTIRIEGNEGSNKLLEVKIDGNYFVLNDDGKASEIFAYPVFIDDNNQFKNKSISYSINIPVGPHTDKKNIVEKRFKLFWEGSKQVPFGMYTCVIDIFYTVL